MNQFSRGQTVQVVPANNDDPEAVANIGRTFVVLSTREAIAGTILVLVQSPNDQRKLKMFRAQDLMAVASA